MIMQAYLIADSGGTKTDWCYVDEFGKRKYFKTPSFHPSQWSDTFVDFFDNFWKEENIPYNATVRFFGAGCSSLLNQNKLALIFNKWGFSNVCIDSDLLGAGKALFQNDFGNFSIMGTGSVFCTYNGKEIIQQHGGLGYLLGDEGGGYYFGKLLLKALLNNELEEALKTKIHKALGTRQTIIEKVYGVKGKAFISSIAFDLKHLKEEREVTEIHKKNFIEFTESYLVPNKVSSISIVGSYAYYQQDILIPLLNDYGILVKEILHYPIVKLTDCLLKGAF
jgi:glucosamine kinase